MSNEVLLITALFRREVLWGGQSTAKKKNFFSSFRGSKVESHIATSLDSIDYKN